MMCCRGQAPRLLKVTLCRRKPLEVLRQLQFDNTDVVRQNLVAARELFKSSGNLRIVRFEDEHAVWSHGADRLGLLRLLLLCLTGVSILTVYCRGGEGQDEVQTGLRKRRREGRREKMNVVPSHFEGTFFFP